MVKKDCRAHLAVELQTDRLVHVFGGQRRERQQCVLQHRAPVQDDADPLVRRQLRQLRLSRRAAGTCA